MIRKYHNPTLQINSRQVRSMYTIMAQLANSRIYDTHSAHNVFVNKSNDKMAILGCNAFLSYVIQANQGPFKLFARKKTMFKKDVNFIT